MSKTAQIKRRFAELITTHMPGLKIIVWDLDGTLGKMPGWDGSDLEKYIEFDIQAVLTFLKTRFGIKNVLISRNGMFCGTDYHETKTMFKQLGFSSVESCYRHTPSSKTRTFRNKKKVMLIDDQWHECKRAIDEGCHAMHLKDHIGRGFLRNKYIVYVQE